jgi:hypothetical protein
LQQPKATPEKEDSRRQLLDDWLQRKACYLKEVGGAPERKLSNSPRYLSENGTVSESAAFGSQEVAHISRISSKQKKKKLMKKKQGKTGREGETNHQKEEVEPRTIQDRKTSKTYRA